MSEYDFKEEFLNSNTTQQHILLMAHFGRAIFYSQLLEQQCINMLAIHEYSNSETGSFEAYEALWNRYDFSKRTLGAMALEIKKAFSIEDDLITELKEVISYRNFLTHNYFRFNDVLLPSESGKMRMIKDFYDFTIRAKKLDVALNGYLNIYNEKHGYNEEKLLEMVEHRKNEWREKYIDDSFDTFKKNN